MSERKPKSLVLIITREFATNLAMPVYIVDADRHLVFFNEAAEEIAGGSYAETGEVPISEWVARLKPETPDGIPLTRDEMPGGIAEAERHPAHVVCITGLDGRKRTLETTAIPLLGPDREFHGIMALFWERP